MTHPAYPTPAMAYAIAPDLPSELALLTSLQGDHAHGRPSPQEQREYLLRQAAYLDRVSHHAHDLRNEGITTASGLRVRDSDDELSTAARNMGDASDQAAELLAAYDREHHTTRGPYPPDPELAAPCAYVRQEYAHWIHH